MAQRILAAIEALALALWIGALAGFAFVFAPEASHAIANLNVFATLVGTVVGKLTLLGFVCGGVALAAALGRRSILRVALLAGMLLLSAYYARIVAPAMEATLHGISAPLATIAKDDPRRVHYRALHRVSGRVYAAVLLLGVVTVVLAAQPKP